MTYSEKLRDPRWQKKRLEIMSRDDFRCQACRSKEKTLNVHHRVYRKGKSPWEYEDDQLVTFCEDCHKMMEDAIRAIAEVCAFNDTMLKIMAHFGSHENIGEYWAISEWIEAKQKVKECPSWKNYRQLQSSALRTIGQLTGDLANISHTITHDAEDEE